MAADWKVNLWGSQKTQAPSSEPKVPREQRVALVGDSITAGTTWGNRLKELMPGWQFDNYGVMGQRSTQVAARVFEDHGEPDQKQVDLSKYGTIIVLCGINNIYAKGQIEKDLRGIYEMAHKQHVRVVALHLTPWKGYGGTPEEQVKDQKDPGNKRTHLVWTPELQQTTDDLNAWIDQQAKAGVVDVAVDLAPVLHNPKDPLAIDPSLTWGDRLHPNVAGQRRMADEIYRVAFSKLLPRS